MSDEITLSRRTVLQLIDGARTTPYQAFDAEKRSEIGMAVNAAEEVLEE